VLYLRKVFDRTVSWVLCLLVGFTFMMPITLSASENQPKSDTPTNVIEELPEIVVVGTTPVPSLGMPLKKVPGNVQSAGKETINQHEPLDLPDFMNRTLSSVTINEVQMNPFQPDVTYRGFMASPLLGTPIGLSVYEDGVRINEPFGDIVNWDLIPRSAIAGIDLIPGSNPLFGLNTLGGALSVRTKSGLSDPGTRMEAYGGTFGRKAFEFEHGGSHDMFDWFVTGNIAEDDGWRPHSDSEIRQLFAKVGWVNESTDLHVSYTFADNLMKGVGPTPESFLNIDRHAFYTAPDNTKNKLNFINLTGSHQMTSDWELAGNIYFRSNTTDTFNSNTGPNCAIFFNLEECLDVNGNLVPAGQNTITSTVQNGAGLTLEASYKGKLFQRENQFTIGTSYDYGHSRFTQSEQPAALTATFDAVTVPNGPFVQSTNVVATNDYLGIFATDTFSLTPWWHITASARWNRADVQLSDQLGTALNGDHKFERLNPAAGFTIDLMQLFALSSPVKELTFYANYSEGMRAPTPIELTCSNPSAPCSLPNSSVSDPSLQPVVARTWETGVREKLSNLLSWNFTVYHTELNNDILFVTPPGGSLSSGYFQNVGNTVREGVEFALQGKKGPLQWYANYSFVRATYENQLMLENAVGPEEVRPGDHIPGIPEHRINAGGEYEVLQGWFLGGGLQYVSSQFVRGDDSNHLPQVSSYVVVNLNTRYKIGKHVELFAMATNVFNQQYETSGQVNTNFFNGQNERFLSPGAPISAWAGMRVNF
jgi:outer membrane receptor protein involved in Fe transport